MTFKAKNFFTFNSSPIKMGFFLLTSTQILPFSKCFVDIDTIIRFLFTVVSWLSLTGDRAQGDDSKHDSHYMDKYSFIAKVKTICCIFNFDGFSF